MPGVDLPQPGQEITAAGNSPWASTKVVKLSGNFVHTDGLPRGPQAKGKGKLDLLTGMTVNMLFPTGPPVTVQVVATGIIWINSKYRALVIRRRTGGTRGRWGVLEMLAASAFPDRGRCKVCAPVLLPTSLVYSCPL